MFEFMMTLILLILVLVTLGTFCLVAIAVKLLGRMLKI